MNPKIEKILKFSYSELKNYLIEQKHFLIIPYHVDINGTSFLDMSWVEISYMLKDKAIKQTSKFEDALKIVFAQEHSNDYFLVRDNRQELMYKWVIFEADEIHIIKAALIAFELDGEK